MTSNGILQIALFFALILVCVRPLGAFMAKVFEGRRTFLHPVLRWLEVLTYKVAGVQEDVEQRWTQYTASVLAFSIFGFLLVYLLQRAQAYLPFNPQNFGTPNVTPDLAFNTAVSFLTNTNWQAYSGETTLSYFVQMAGLTVQNFVSAAAGLAIAVAVIRGFARHEVRTLGNFWVDMTRSVLYVLLPISFLGALFLCSQGVIQNLKPYTTVTTVEGAKQIITQGPVASQEAIKELGTNGGGFFNANSGHPYENPTPLTNTLELLAMFLIAFALTFTFGKMVGDTRQGWVVLTAMLLLFLPLVWLGFHSEQHGNPLIAQQGIDQVASATQAGGNMEGKETRFGIASSALWVAVATGTSTGAVNSAHDSLTPLGGFVPMFLMQLGEVAPGGVGTGIYSVLMFAILGVFIAGLMIGRTPEYLGKKIEALEMKLASIFILTTPFVVLIGTAVAVLTEAGKAGIGNPGAHGFSEILYAFTSAGNNNGSAFGGLAATSVFYNVSIGLTMFIGRYWPIMAALAIAGSLAQKKRVPVTEGTMPTHGPLFVALLLGSILLIGVLTLSPALALGPIVEHFMLPGGR